jgi:hypothetical protein
MKYAYIIGSNAFIVPGKSIFVGEGENERKFLMINSIHHDTNEPVQSFLDIDLDIKDTDGSPVTILSNKPATGAPYRIEKKNDSVKVLRSDGSLIIHVHQLNDKAAMGLEHNITAELNVNTPVAVIRLSGDFLVDGLHVSAENEKLYINDNGYASSAQSGKNKLLFTSSGVVI